MKESTNSKSINFVVCGLNFFFLLPILSLKAKLIIRDLVNGCMFLKLAFYTRKQA